MASAPDPVVWTFQRLPEANALTDLNYRLGGHLLVVVFSSPLGQVSRFTSVRRRGVNYPLPAMDVNRWGFSNLVEQQNRLGTRRR
jgi:hypothetical protein